MFTDFLKCTLIVTVTLSSALAFAQAPPLAKMDVVERSIPAGPVAMLNGEPISRDKFLLLYHQQIISTSRIQGSMPDDRTRVMTGLNTLGELLRRTLLVQDAEKRGIKVDDAVVAKELDTQLKLIQEQLKEHEGKSVTLDEILAKGKQTREEAMTEMREAILIEQMYEVIAKEMKVTVDSAEVKTFYDENPRLFTQRGGVKFKQIFMFPKPDATSASDEAWAESEKRIRKAQARIRAGESFDKVARDMSESTTGKPMIDVGPAAMESLPPFFQDAAATLKPNGISDVMKSDHGYHMMQLIETANDKTVSLEKATPKIREMLLGQKSKEAVGEYCQPRLESSESMEVYLDLEKALAGSAQAREAAEGS